MAGRGEGEQTVATNRKARHDYELVERFEAGIELTGDEVKSLREGRASLVDCRDRRWGLDGAPLDGGSQPPLQRFAARVDNGAVIADLSRPVAGPGAPR